MKLIDLTENFDVNEVVDKIERDCAPWFKYIGGIEDASKLIYRGLHGVGEFGVKQVRKGRIPLETYKVVHRGVDQVFKEKFGHPYRSNSMFASKKAHIASVYGNIYAVFPIGPVKACWSRNDDFTDMTLAWGNFAIEHKLDHEHPTEGQIMAFVTEGNYVEGNMDEFFSEAREDTELMVKCDSYYCVNFDRAHSTLKELLMRKIR